MNTAGALKVQREILRLRLQVHRTQMALKFKRPPAGSRNPRSLTMRLLTRQPSLGLWVLAEFLPILLRHFFGGYNREAFAGAEDEDEDQTYFPRTRHTKRSIR